MGSTMMFGPRRVEKSLPQKLRELNWFIVLALAAIAGIGCAMLYSVAGGNVDPWASRQVVRFGIALLMMIAIALVDLRTWLSLAYPAYLAGLALLGAVEVIGVTGMGGQRWLDLGVMRLQPSELMKIAVVMALARYYHGLTLYQTRAIKSLFVPMILIVLPVILVVRQPDLGTALMVVAGGIAMIFLAGARMWLFGGGLIAAIAAIPIAWRFLRDYQRERVLTFLNPDRDPLGAGYQIIQSKIALGSGGLTGKGFLQGTQSHLNFLPEMKTDFIFTVLAEEFGVLGALALLMLFFVVIGYGLWVGFTCRNHFGRLLSTGLSITIFLYVFINIAMVMGLLPVVGVPLPLVSYGGSAMLTAMIAFGLILSVALNRRVAMPRRGGLA